MVDGESNSFDRQLLSALLCSMRKHSGDYHPGADTMHIMTMKISKVFGLPAVALSGASRMPAAGENEQEAVRVFYVTATRATQKLVIGVGG